MENNKVGFCGIKQKITIFQNNFWMGVLSLDVKVGFRFYYDPF